MFLFLVIVIKTIKLKKWQTKSDFIEVVFLIILLKKNCRTQHWAMWITITLRKQNKTHIKVKLHSGIQILSKFYVCLTIIKTSKLHFQNKQKTNVNKDSYHNTLNHSTFYKLFTFRLWSTDYSTHSSSE